MFANTDSELPEVWKTLDDWEKNKSTKWDITLRILKRCLATDDDAMLPRWEKNNIPPLNGELVIPEEDDFEADPNAKSKTVIYVEFTRPLEWFVPVSIQLLRRFITLIMKTLQLLKLHGFNPLLVTGRESPKDRTKALLDFKDPNLNNRLLVLSPVGSAGLNLHEAKHLIILVSSGFE